MFPFLRVRLDFQRWNLHTLLTGLSRSAKLQLCDVCMPRFSHNSFILYACCYGKNWKRPSFALLWYPLCIMMFCVGHSPAEIFFTITLLLQFSITIVSAITLSTVIHTITFQLLNLKFEQRFYFTQSHWTKIPVAYLFYSVAQYSNQSEAVGLHKLE